MLKDILCEMGQNDWESTFILVLRFSPFIAVSYICIIDKILFGGKISKTEIFGGFTRFQAPSNRKITFLAFDLAMCVSGISITPKQIIVETPKLVFYICIAYVDAT